MSDKTCGTCQRAAWQLTPTGRIKRGTSGHCAVERELLSIYTHQAHAPCIAISPPRRTAIWPDYKADACPLYQDKP